MRNAVSTTPPLAGAALVSQVNELAQSLGTDFAGAIDPASMAWPYSLWADTGNGILNRRNAANTAWVAVGKLMQMAHPQYSAASIPTSDIGPIYVVGIGDMEWDATSGKYLPVFMGSQGIINNTGAVSDLKLQLGQAAFVDFVSANSVPLHIATGDNQKYELEFLCNATSAPFSSLELLLPNNTSYTNFFFSAGTQNGSTIGNPSVTTMLGYSNGFAFHNALAFGTRALVTTKTAAKTVAAFGVGLSAGGMLHEIGASLWLATAGSNAGADTTTLWTSLGTVSFPVARTGRIVIRRVA